MNCCEICGTPLTDGNRSKSYKHRCKPCVALQTKAKRRGEKPATTSDIKQAVERSLSVVAGEVTKAIGAFDKAEVIENGQLLLHRGRKTYRMTLYLRLETEQLQPIAI